MKICSVCGQSVAEDIKFCPSCGNEIGEGRRSINGYRIVDILHEGYSSLLCHAVREGTDEHVMIRLFTPDSGVNEDVAARLQQEIEALKELKHEGLVRPSPMLKKLLSSHPDIIHERPLDFRSDIWSLGKVFVELLSADLDTIEYLNRIEDLEVPQQVKVLLRVMLADDPDLRPSSMEEIVLSLQGIQEELKQQGASPPREVPAHEGSKDKSMALRFYREAMGSFLADWLEYDFARERIKTVL
jgi:hypothetical protein